MKEYDAKIERLYTDLLINGRTDAEAKESIEWKWNNQKQSKMTYADALNALIAHEGAVATLLNEAQRHV